MWDFVVDPALPDHEAELLAHIRNREISDDLDDDAVFMSSYIPRSLAEVYDPERDVEVVKAGKGDQLIYAGIAGLKREVAEADSLTEPLARGVRFDDEEINGDEAAHDHEDETAGVDGADADADVVSSGGGDEDKPRGFRHEDKETKKVRPAL
jgi:RIO kinase 1